jgi:hypothetical protein
MSGRHGHKRKKQNTTDHSAPNPVVNDSRCQEHPDRREEKDMENAVSSSSQSRNWQGRATLFIAVLALLTSFQQACIMRQAMRMDQRAWVVIAPETPGREATHINRHAIASYTLVMSNTGKTLAKKIDMHFVFRDVSIDEEPDFRYDRRDYPVDHSKVGTVYPEEKKPVRIPMLRFTPPDDKLATPITWDENPVGWAGVASTTRYLIVYGKLTYFDGFNTPHWVHYCVTLLTPDQTGTYKDAPSKKCVEYNDADHDGEEEPTR